jgi:hypothetical protein
MTETSELTSTLLVDLSSWGEHALVLPPPLFCKYSLEEKETYASELQRM